MIDVDGLSASLGDDAPAGPNLEYDLEFQALETAAREKPDQEFGKGNVIAGEDANWAEVRELALRLGARTRDLRVAVFLARALTRLDGLAGLANGLELVAALVERLWEQVHPQPDADDPNDYTMRMNALMVLTDAAALVRDIRRATFMTTRMGGTVSVRQVEVGLGIAEKGDSNEEPLPRAQIEGMLREAAAEGMTNGAKAALAALDRIAAALKEKVDVHQRVDLRPLAARLSPLAAFFSEVVPQAVEEPVVAEQPQAPGQSGTAPAPAPAPPGEIRSRDDVIRVLGKVCDYLESNEPTNPAPLLIRRAQKLMTMSFVDILRDVAPEGVASISKIAGLPGEGQ